MSKMVDRLYRDEYRAMRAACSKRTRLGASRLAMIDLMYQAGMRNCEICRMRITDIQLDGDDVMIRIRASKRLNSRDIWIPAEAAESLRVWLTWRDKMELDHDRVFCNVTARGGAVVGRPLITDELDEHGRPNTRTRAVDSAWEGLAKKASIVRDTWPHMARHAAASERLDAGWALTDVQLFLGHKSIRSTMVYLNSSPGRQRDLTRSFNAA